MTAALSIGGGILLLLPTLLPLMSVDWWWARIWDFPRVQLAVLYGVALGGVLVWARKPELRWGLGGLCLLALAYQLSWIALYLPGFPQQTLDATTDDPRRLLRILIANVLMTNRVADPLMAMVARTDPDVLVLTEPDAWWVTRLGVLEDRYPYRVTYPLANTYGMCLYSRLPLVTAEVRFLVEPAIPSIHARLRLRTGDLMTLIALHPRPPRPAQDTGERDAELILAGREARAAETPVVVAGDLNDVGWSTTTILFQQVSGLLDPRRGRGLYATYHARYPFWRYPLDHLFHARAFRIRRLAVLEYFGSDHFPLFVELSYEPEHTGSQPSPSLTPEAREQAREQLQRGLRAP